MTWGAARLEAHRSSEVVPLRVGFGCPHVAIEAPDEATPAAEPNETKEDDLFVVGVRIWMLESALLFYCGQ